MTYTSLKSVRYVHTRKEFITYALRDISGDLLDVGNLGEGHQPVDVRSIFGDRGTYYGFDVNQNLAESLGVTNQIIGDLHQADMIPDEKFSIIYAGEIIEHTWKPGVMITECNRILKKDGFLILDTPNVYDWINIGRLFLKKKDTVGMDDRDMTYNEAKDNFQKLRTVDKVISSQPQHKIFYSPAMLRQLLNMHGFEIVEFVFIGKPRNALHKFLLKVFPQGSQKLGVIARKRSLEDIFVKKTNE